LRNNKGIARNSKEPERNRIGPNKQQYAESYDLDGDDLEGVNMRRCSKKRNRKRTMRTDERTVIVK